VRTHLAFLPAGIDLPWLKAKWLGNMHCYSCLLQPLGEPDVVRDSRHCITMTHLQLTPTLYDKVDRECARQGAYCLNESLAS